ncbi:MAG: hypothetical protein U1F77_05520 [Kiritimatiellia bacterium]
MRRLLSLASAFLAGILVWAVLSWPLPAHFTDCVPRHSTNPEGFAVRTMPSGDHLQLLYHFSLVTDMIRGNTPWFTNLYEFNTGDDAARRRPGPWFMPFSLVHAAGELAAGKAFGFNLALALAGGLTGLFGFLLARRYSASLPFAALAALYGLLLPYRQVVLLGGSPTGFAMTFVPAFALGVDIAVRDRRMAGGWLAGAAVLGVISDFHVLYYLGMFGVIFLVLSLLAGRRDPDTTAPAGVASLLRAFAPAAGLALLAAGLRAYWSLHLNGTGALVKKNLAELAIFAPRPEGVFNFLPEGSNHLIHLGGWLLLPLAAGVAAGLWTLLRGRDPGAVRGLAVLVAGLGALAVLILLALGPYAPWDGRPLHAARKLLPLYDKIRQPAKIFCLVPSLVTVILAMALELVRAARPLRRRTEIIACAAAAAGLLAHFGAQINPALCRLKSENQAWAAVASDAPESAPARALVIPLWPGDSTWSSIYEHYALAHRLRMVNGYSPAIPAHYLDGVWQPLMSINQGDLRPDQLSLLRQMGVTHILLQEDAFPEKVSPFPVAATIEGLLACPRLKLIARDGPTWAFRLADKGGGEVPEWTWRFPNRIQSAEGVARKTGRPAAPLAPGAGLTGAEVLTGRLSGGARRGPALARARPGRGPSSRDHPGGRRRHHPGREGRARPRLDLDLRADHRDPEAVPLRPRLHRTGRLGRDRPLDPRRRSRAARDGAGRIHRPPPAAFYHAGAADLTTGAVHFRRDWDPDDHVLYGPKLPLAPGRYLVELQASSDAPPDTGLGQLTLRQPVNAAEPVPVRPGQPARLAFTVTDNLPVEWSFRFSRRADCGIGKIRLTRTR